MLNTNGTQKPLRIRQAATSLERRGCGALVTETFLGVNYASLKPEAVQSKLREPSRRWLVIVAERILENGDSIPVSTMSVRMCATKSDLFGDDGLRILECPALEDLDPDSVNALVTRSSATDKTLPSEDREGVYHAILYLTFQAAVGVGANIAAHTLAAKNPLVRHLELSGHQTVAVTRQGAFDGDGVLSSLKPFPP